jgi:LacI family transcriptional regulator
VVTGVRNPYFAELAMALEVALDESGYALLQAYSRDEREREDRLLELMVEHRVDGVFLVPSKDTSHEDLHQRLGLNGTPYVLIARQVPEHDADYVGIDNVRGGKLLGEHLATEGYERVAFLGGPRSTARADRQRGLRAGLKRHGVPLDPALSVQSSADRAGGIAAVESLLALGPPPDAVACYSDVVAFGVISGLRAAGMEPGRDVAVGSFDDIPEASLHHPALTSVAGYPDRVGAEASRLLLERMRSPELAPRRVLLAPRLSVRASTTTREPRHT